MNSAFDYSAKYDVAIIGSGFAGSLLAWILANRGRRVALIDAAQHPRFAIGESSTPIADMLLRRLGEKHAIAPLVDMSTYGKWQQRYPEIACGKKRGFSYYKHFPNERFTDSELHKNSLLVAASPTDSLSDTHWYRSDVDHFFFQNAITAGATDFSGHNVTRISLDYTNEITFANQESLRCDYLVDASGAACVTGNLLGAKDRIGELQTNTRSIFAHYKDVDSWSQVHGWGDDPFDGDDAAQHHLIDDGWLWMLRFNNGITSVGMTMRSDVPRDLLPANYPSILALFDRAKLVQPSGGPATTGRLQRFFHPVLSKRCWMLPTAAVTIDPLHSTGIAHALAGVDRSADLIFSDADRSQVDAYGQIVADEALFLDKLVSSSYRSINEFEAFTASCMLYFAGAIVCEESMQRGDQPKRLWNCDEKEFVNVANEFTRKLSHLCSIPRLIDQLRTAIQPWNTAGLLDEAVRNRYAYTATKR